MRTIERTGQFKRDYKREVKGRSCTTLAADLVPVLVALGKMKFWNHVFETMRLAASGEITAIAM